MNKENARCVPCMHGARSQIGCTGVLNKIGARGTQMGRTGYSTLKREVLKWRAQGTQICRAKYLNWAHLVTFGTLAPG